MGVKKFLDNYYVALMVAVLISLVIGMILFINAHDKANAEARHERQRVIRKVSRQLLINTKIDSMIQDVGREKFLGSADSGFSGGGELLKTIISRCNGMYPEGYEYYYCEKLEGDVSEYEAISLYLYRVKKGEVK